MIKALQGYKTYVLGAIGILTGIGSYAGFIPDDVANPIFAFVIPLMGITFKAGMNRIEEKLK